MADGKIKALVEKLRAMAEHSGGNENEKANAARLLKALMEKHGINEDSFTESVSEGRSLVYFNYGGDWVKEMILLQCIIKVFNKIPEFYKDTRLKTHRYYLVEVTKLEEIEISYLTEFYTALFKRELEMFKTAFIQKHRLFEDKICSDVKMPDKKTINKIKAMMGTMSNAKPKKVKPKAKPALEDGSAKLLPGRGL